MDLLRRFIDIFLHLDTHLSQVIAQYGTGTHLILFLIVFCETGLVVTPFLPGDSLLFAAGTFAALGALDLWLVIVMRTEVPPAGVRTTKPSAPTPFRRSQNAATIGPVHRSAGLVRPSSITKSLPDPVILKNAVPLIAVPPSI